MRRIGLSLTALIVMIGVAFGAPPSVSLPSEIPISAGRIIQLDPKPKDVEKSIWTIKYGVGDDGKLIKTGQVDLIPVCDGNTAFFASKYNGKYAISLTVWNKEGVTQIETTIVVTNGDNQEDKTDPNPNPNPTPPNPNKVSKVYIAVVRDPTNVGPSLAAVLADTKFWEDLTVGGSDWDFFTFTSKDAENKGYLKEAKKITGNETEFKVPVIVILDNDKVPGKVLKTAVLPMGISAKEDIKKLISEVKK